MANPTNTTKPAPAAPTAPVGAPAAPTGAAEIIKRGTDSVESYDSVESAQKAIEGRTKGARRIYEVELPGKPKFVVVATHHHFVMQKYFLEMGAKCDEVGKTARASKPLDLDGLLNTVTASALPADQKDKVLAQLKALQGNKQKV